MLKDRNFIQKRTMIISPSVATESFYLNALVHTCSSRFSNFILHIHLISSDETKVNEQTIFHECKVDHTEVIITSSIVDHD